MIRVKRMSSQSKRYKCKQTKYEWLNEKCAESEKLQNIAVAGRHKILKEIAGRNNATIK